MGRIKYVMNKNQFDMLWKLPIRYTYKHKIRHICERRNLRVESVLDYILRVYFEDLRIFDRDFLEV